MINVKKSTILSIVLISVLIFIFCYLGNAYDWLIIWIVLIVIALVYDYFKKKKKR